MERIKKENKSRNFKDFSEALEYIYSNIEPTERSAKEILSKDVLLIDFDGVLLETNIKQFLLCLFYYLFVPTKFEEFIKTHKVPLKYIYKIAKIIKNGAKVIILSSRILSDKNYFPFISKEKVEKMKNLGIDFYSIPKYAPYLELKEEFINKLDRERMIYIGSSILDKRLFNLIKEKLKDRDLIYLEIGGGGLL